MRAESLQAGTCVDLPPAVVDKYFLANFHTDRFQHLTARAICGRCAIQAACLADAISRPTEDVGIRGGEAPNSIAALRKQYLQGEIPAAVLARDAIRRQPLTPAVLDSPTLRRGDFADTPLLDGPLTAPLLRRPA